ncbi:hypothetical protein [Aeromicrobium sp. P5_D10]
MNKHTSDQMTAALRDLDPAPKTDLTEAERQHADDTFVRIIATPIAESPPVGFDRPRRRRTRLLLPIGLLGVAGVAATALVFGGGSALASWTPTPELLTPAETSAAASTCRADIGMPAKGGATLVAERRGKWTYVLVSEPTGEATCLMRNHLVGQDPAGHEVFGSYDTEPETPTVASDGILEMGSTATSIDEGWFRGESWLTWTYGYVGSGVTGVMVHTPLGFDVEASVNNGRFAAWWPSDKPSSKNLEVMGAWSYTVTLADGSTRRQTTG